MAQDTVGAIAVDEQGVLCAGVSSGGLSLKLPGRVGHVRTMLVVLSNECHSVRQPCMAVAAGHRTAMLRTLLDLPVAYQVYVYMLDIICHVETLFGQTNREIWIRHL